VEYDASTYGERIAPAYDAVHRHLPSPGAAVALLTELARRGPALELGIGTGRIALPLTERGVVVHGIDASPAMVNELRAKPGGDRIPVTLGDFADVGVPGQYPLIYVVFNTFFNLLTQEDQVRCFAQVASHLTADGCFVMEAFVPDLTRYDHGQRMAVSSLALDQVQLDAAQVDPATQMVEAQRVVITEAGIRLYPVRVRYAWPSELDLMARLAGMRLRERWGGWQHEPFTGTSQIHVSVWEKADVPTSRYT
jgi:SAM-dependent methyltransferase